MSSKKPLSAKEQLEEKKKKLEEMRTRNKKPNEPTKADVENVTSLDAAIKLAEQLTGTKAESPVETSKVTHTPSTPATVSVSATTPSSASSKKRPRNLAFKYNVVDIDIPPKEVETYTKGTQTTDSTPVNSTSTGTGNAETTGHKETGTPHVHGESSIVKKHEEQVPNGTSSQTATKVGTESQIPELSPQEKESIIGSNEFASFVTKSSKLIERAIFAASKYDIAVDYSQADDSQSTKDEKSKEVRLLTKLFDERWSKYRAVTDLAWSPKYNDLVAASYSANEQGGSDADGLVLVWSVHNALQRPEFRFHCQSPVLSVIFHKFSPSIVVGGTYSGQIVLWDTRARATPVQHSPLSSVGHTHPVYSLEIVGSKNAHNLTSISTDGKLCVWSLENLLQPMEVLELHNRQSRQVTAAPVAVTTLAFPDSEVNCFFVGSEEGAIYEGYRHGSKQGIYERYDGHYGPVTAIDFHSASGSVNFSDFFITSSTDWTCKLWSQKHGTKFIYSFEDAADYIYDIRWCPTHPALFGTVDGTGTMSLWNLNEDTEVPVLKTQVSQKALNKMRWSQDGKKILTGDSMGYLYIYDSGEISVSRENDWTIMESTIQKLIQLEQQDSQQPSQSLDKKDVI